MIKKYVYSRGKSKKPCNIILAWWAGDTFATVYFILAKKYLDIIDAPKKAFFSFDNSAHSPNMEEPEKFIQIFCEIILENNY